MKDRISSIVPLFLITILSVVGVEALYQALEFFLFKPTTVVSQEARPIVARQPSGSEEPSTTKPDYRVILQRNLFTRPGAETSEDNVAQAGEPEPPKATELGIVLMGTISGSDNSRRAIILNKSTRDQEIYSTGEVIEGALIKEIQRGKVILSLNDNDEILDMSEAAEMRPAYKPPRQTTTKNSQRPSSVEGNNRSTNVSSAPVPRRRVVRRSRATGNTPAPTGQQN